MAKKMFKTKKNYIVNIDFPTCKDENGHKLHLNPYNKGSVSREKILRHYDPKNYKRPVDGGAIYLTKLEADMCLKGGKSLEWQGKLASTFRPCKLCNRLPEWNI